MKKLVLFSCFLLPGLPAANGQAETPPTEETPLLQDGGEALEPPPRVVGKPRSKEEYDAFQAIVETEDVAQRVSIADAFLQNYPDSGMTAYVHHYMADAANQANDVESFMLHAEKALLELPKATDLLAQLARIYSEKGQALKATNYANRALPLLDDMEKQSAIPSIEWVTMRQNLKADAHYALGRSYLQTWHSSSIKPPKKLEQAIKHLYEVLELAPDYAYAAFRLGFCQKNADNTEAALAAYARAAIIEGPAAGLAKKNVKKIHKTLQKTSSTKWAGTNVDLILKDESDRLRVLLKEKNEELARLAAQIDSQEIQDMLQLPGDVPLPTLPGN